MNPEPLGSCQRVPPAPGFRPTGPGGWPHRLLLCLALSLGAALQAAPPERVTLQLKWRHQFQFAGYYAAQEKGYYRDAGLDVKLVEGGPTVDPVQEVASGRAQFGTSNSALLLARHQGYPVVVLAVILQHSPLVLIARADAGIRSVQDLAGRRVMLEPHSEELLAYLADEQAPVQSLHLVNHSFEIADLMSGKVDAMAAYSTDEPYFLDRAGFRYLMFTPRSGGIDFYGDNLFTSEAELRSHPARVKAFREASLKGWKYALQHPEELADLILTRYSQRHDRDFLLNEAREMADLAQPRLVEMGYTYTGRWQHIAGTYADLGLLPKDFTLEGFLYDPEASDRLTRQRMKVILTVILPIVLLLAVLALVFFWQYRRLSHALAAAEELGRELQQNEQKFRFLAENSADVIWTMDLFKGTFTYVSPSVYQLRGYTAEEVMAQSAAEALTPESMVRVQQVLAETLAEWKPEGPHTPQVTEVDQPHKDGHLVPTEVVTTLHANAAGRPVSVLGVSRDITERRRAEEKLHQTLASLEQLASRDPLTNAWNRRHFEASVEGEMHRARRHGHPLALLLFDIDHFKRVNDTHGHPEGDRVLREVADCVRGVIRVSDSLTRWGGEEFIVLMPNTPFPSALVLAERLREAIAGHVFEGIGQVTVSVGLAAYRPPASRDEWVERADRALYLAKQGGRNQVQPDPTYTKEPVAPDEGSFLKLVWKEAYRSGHPVIDAQHERLFQVANDLLDSVLAARPPQELSHLVNGLLEEVGQHFRDEEEILRELGFPGLPDHARKHADLLAEATEVERAFRAGTLSSGRLFQFLAQDVVAVHMLKEDREFFDLTGAT